MAQPHHSMSKETLASGDGGRVAAVTDVDSAARYFAGTAKPQPANDSADEPTGEQSGAGGVEDPEEDDPENAGGGAAEGGGAAAADGGDSEEDELKKQPGYNELPDWARKRMGEISAAKNTANSRVSELEKATGEKDATIADLQRQLAAKGSPAPAPTAENPLAHIEDPQALQRELDNAINLHQWCEENPDGGTIELSDGKTREVSAEEVRAAKASTTRMIHQHIPARAQYLEGRRQYVEVAKQAYPEIFKEGSEDARQYQALLSHWPELRRFVDPEIIVGRYLRGLRAEEAEKQAKQQGNRGAEAGKKKPATAIAPSTPRQPATPTPVGASSGKDAETSAARKVANASGSVDDVARFFSRQKVAA